MTNAIEGFTRSQEGAHAASAQSPGQPLLVILDDEAEVAGTMVTMSERNGVAAITTTSSEAFFQALSQHNPTHIVLDLMMPKIDGVMVLERLKQMNCTAALIIASGAEARVVDASARTAVEYGLNLIGTLAKPFSARQFGALLSMADGPNAQSAAGEIEPAQGKTPTWSDVGPDELRAALSSGEIQPHFQPKVSCANGELVGFEALARWMDKNGTGPTPETFIEMAEQSGQIDRLTERVMSDAISWFGENFPSGKQSISINVSAYSLTDTHILDLVEQLCDSRDLALDRIVLEITESGTLGPDTELLNLLTRMRLKGIQLSLDDFGVGYSSIEQLARLPFSELKIDKRFVSAVCHSQEARTIVNAVIGMARGLNLKTVAEGIEDLATFNYLQEHGCDVAQGFFIGRPMAAERAAQWSGQD